MILLPWVFNPAGFFSREIGGWQYTLLKGLFPSS